MEKTVVVVHTGPVTVQPLKKQFEEQLPGVRVVNIIDDSLLNDVLAAGHLTKEVSQRMFNYYDNAQNLKADVILNACSSVGEAADALEPLINVPIVKVDASMADQASELGTRIGVVATLPTTLNPTVRLIEKKAAQKGKQIEVVRRIAEGAFEALIGGDGERHDEILKTTIQDLMNEVDVVVLAQVSMARLVASLGETKVPVLSSPVSGVAAVKQLLESLEA